jgi:hypothetical protein
VVSLRWHVGSGEHIAGLHWERKRGIFKRHTEGVREKTKLDGIAGALGMTCTHLD